MARLIFQPRSPDFIISAIVKFKSTSRVDQIPPGLRRDIGEDAHHQRIKDRPPILVNGNVGAFSAPA